jgi:hypothetical protein
MIRKILLRLAATLVLIAASVCCCGAAPCSLQALNWIAGSWHNATNPQEAQERWVVAPDGALMGSAWEIPKGKPGFAEIMTIRQDGNSTSMILRHFDGGLSRAWEERDAPMVFTASSCEGTSAVFDGGGSHVGEHMTYKRSDQSLLIIGEFLHNGKPTHAEWHMIRVGD